MINRTVEAVLNLSMAFIVFYGFCATVYIALHVLVGEQLQLVAILDNFMPLLLLPAVPLALLCLALGYSRFSLALAPAILMLVASYGALLLPGHANAAVAGKPLTLLTYNLHGDLQTRGKTPVVDLVKQANADVVTLQELSPTMAQDLEPLYPYHAMHTNKDSLVVGQGVLSRYPIVEDDYWVMELGMQRVVLDVNGTRVTLYNVHIRNPFVRGAGGPKVDVSKREVVVNDLLRRTANEHSPLIIAGDYNMTDQTTSYQQISARYHDTFREVGTWLGFTYPADQRMIPPLARIDYVFHDDSMQSVAARVWPTSGGSDHRPVWVELSIHTP
ncbi:MAG TPA: endonuclease/exonuclease/phosphatase family protein [Anaerolineae bacterium]